jgi:ABC-type hemin transport system substrate-binding protein
MLSTGPEVVVDGHSLEQNELLRRLARAEIEVLTVQVQPSAAGADAYS